MTSTPTRKKRTRSPVRPPLYPPLRVVGLTGGIASGKSTIAALFADCGATVINADHVGHAILTPGEPALAEVVAAFGREYLQSDGTLDRKSLGSRVFSHPHDLAILNRITHPRIAAEIARQLSQLARNHTETPADPPRPRLVILEAALLIEAGWQRLVDHVLVVSVEPEVQVARLTASRGMTPDQARRRIQAQFPLERRLELADFILSGDEPLSLTGERVRALSQQLLS